ncbi:hypothetical protein ACFLRC_02390 [Candidatus Altiarchaeota archaeon]
MKHRVFLSGSFPGGNDEKLFHGLRSQGILQFSLVGREITLQVDEDSLDKIKDSLQRLGVSNLSILEWKKIGLTVSGSGKGGDPQKLSSVSLIPTALNEGVRCLSRIHEIKLEEEFLGEIDHRIQDVLAGAGVTDVLYTFQLQKKSTKEKYLSAVESATLNAIFDAGGVMSID